MLFGVVGEDIGFNAVFKACEFFADAAQVSEPLVGKVKGHKMPDLVERALAELGILGR